MAADRIRLAVAAALFVGWLGWLAYLALTASDPIILSRPQFLVADAWVVADLQGDAGHPLPHVNITEIVWSETGAKQLAQGQELTVLGLDRAGPQQNWHGAGSYILPLSHVGKDRFALTPIPDSPGYPPPRRADDPPLSPEEKISQRLRIYPATSSTLKQVKALRQAWKQ